MENAESKTEQGPLILVVTPSHDGKVVTNYFLGALHSSMPEWSELFRLGFLVQEGGSLISKARDYLTAQFYFETNADYLLFIDSDQSFHPLQIKMLLDVITQRGYDIAAAPVPSKRFESNGRAFSSAMHRFDEKRDSQDKFMFSAATDYNFVEAEGQTERLSVRHAELAGTGMMLIPRKAIARMYEYYLEKEQNGEIHSYEYELEAGGSKKIPPLFNPIVLYPNYFGEDYSFCLRAGATGLRIGVDTRIQVVHTGSFDYQGNFLAFESYRDHLKNVAQNGFKKNN